MTRLQYLKCRNRLRLTFEQLPEVVKALFIRVPTIVEEYHTTDWRGPVPVSGSPGHGRYSPTRRFRIPEDCRPPGIPEAIHRRYDS